MVRQDVMDKTQVELETEEERVGSPSPASSSSDSSDEQVLNSRRSFQEEQRLLSRKTTLSDNDDEFSFPRIRAPQESRSWWNVASIYWLIPPFFLMTMAYGGLLVPKINLVLALICQQHFKEETVNDPERLFGTFGNANEQCNTPEIQSLLAKFTLAFNLVCGGLSAITSPKLGALSDRYGRTKLLAINSVGLLVNEGLAIVIATHAETISYQWLLVGYAIDGIFGSFAATMAISQSYAADCSTPEQRNVVFGVFHGLLFSGVAFGPIITGFVAEATGSLISVFYIALCCHVMFAISVLCIIPDSLSKERQTHAREKHSQKIRNSSNDGWGLSNVLKSVANVFSPLSILYPTGEGSTRALRLNILSLATVDTLMFGVSFGSATVIIIYAEYIFHWTNLDSSIFTSIVNVCRVGNLFIVFPLITRWVRGSRTYGGRSTGMDKLDLYIIRVSVLFEIVGYIGYATVRSGSLMILSGCIASLGGMGAPTLESSLTKHIPSDRTGEILGALGLLHALARVVAPTAFNLIYSATVATFPQTVFVYLSIAFGVTFLISWVIKPYVYLDELDSPAEIFVPDYENDGDEV